MASKLKDATDSLGPARWQGALFDMGTHPAAVQLGDLPTGYHRTAASTDAATDTVVHGDLLRLTDPAAIAWLDAYEELDAPPVSPWFLRDKTTVVDARGVEHACWIYRFERAPTPETGTRIPSGDYLAYLAALPPDRQPKAHESPGQS